MRNKALSQFQLSFIPLILLSKLVRWTIMKPQLVDMSIGWNMIRSMVVYGAPSPHLSISDMSNSASPATNNAAWLFHTLTFGYFDSTNLVADYIGYEIFITLFFNVIFFFIVSNFLRNNPDQDKKSILFIYLNMAMLNIFSFNLAKEPYQLIFFLIIAVLVMRGKTYKSKTILALFGILLMTVATRKYFGIMIIYFSIMAFLANGWLMSIKSKVNRIEVIRNLAILAILFSAIYFALLTTLESQAEDTYDEMAYANSRTGTPAVSEITPVFGSGNRVALTLDYFIKIFRLLFPVELLIKGKVTYILLITYQWLIFLLMIKGFQRGRYGNDNRILAIYLYIAFVLVSASFEPDFGSWTRHESVLFPITLLLLTNDPRVKIIRRV